MSALIQYDLFEVKPTEEEVMRIDIEAIRESSHKVRKALFARHGELQKRYVELEIRMDVIERHLCQKK